MSINKPLNASRHLPKAKDTEPLSGVGDTNIPSHQTSSAPLTASLIDAQIVFIKQWYASEQQQNHLLMQFWEWLGNQSLARYTRVDMLIGLINDWALAQPMSDNLREDIRAVAFSVIFHPINDDVALSELIEDSQISQIATYIASHQNQRHMLIHSLIGNDTFADLLTQTLYHAINDFMESSLEKAGGVGKLMKLGRSSFEKATNHNLDEKLQTYLHRNIKDLTHRAEHNAKQHLTNEEVARLIESGWARIKDEPVSLFQQYLIDTDIGAPAHTADADIGLSGLKNQNNALNRLEANLQDSYNRFRVSSYAHTLVAAAVQTWYQHHRDDSIAQVLATYHLDLRSLESQPALAPLLASLNQLLTDLLNSPWIDSQLRQMLQAFYDQPAIQSMLHPSQPTGYPSL